jgi:positive regulator of sigma E activity
VRLLPRRADLEGDASGAIYGTIITASTIVGVTEGVHELWRIAITVVGTLALYSIAHAYARVLGGPVAPSLRTFGRELAVESPMLSACVLPLLVMVVASLLGADLELAGAIALWSAAAMLFIWGFLAAQKASPGVVPQLVSGATFGLVGLGIVALRVVTSH